MVFFTIANLRRLLVYASDFLLKERRMISWVTNLSIHLPQVPWWLPTTCARPKSASRRTATAATAATTRTSATSSPSSSARTPACVSSFIYYSVFSSTRFCWPLLLSAPLDSLFLCLLTFLHSAPLVSLLFCSFYPPSFLFLSLPSDQIYPIAMLALLSCCIIAKPVTLHRRAGMCVRLCAHLCVCVCPRAVAELLLQIFDRKRLFHPALLHNGFN